MKNMKKNYIITIIMLTTCFALSACSKKTDSESETPVTPSEAISEVIPEVSEETSEEAYPEPTDPVAVFTGDPEKVVVFEKNSYYEADKFFIYFGAGSEVRDDTIENLTKVMNDVEELFGMSYETDRVMEEDNWRHSYYGGSFEYVNPTGKKPDILILPDPEDDTVEWAFQNTVMLYDSTLDPNGETYDTTYHELTHLLFAKQSGSLGQVMDEGVASYAQYELAKQDNYPAWSTIQFLEYGGYHSTYDDSAIYSDPEGEFMASTTADRDARQRHYQYGIRFVTFLTEKYGPDIMSKICDTANEKKLDNGNEQPYKMVEIIKEATSDDVFNEFAAWLPSGWNEWGRKYTEYMKQFGL